MKSLFCLLLMCLAFAPTAYAYAAPTYTDADEAAINAFMSNPVPMQVSFDAYMVDTEGWLNLLIRLSSGYELSMQVDMLDFPLKATNNLVSIDFLNGYYFFQDARGELRATGADQVAVFMTASEEETRYFCLRRDGDESSGPILKSAVTVAVNSTVLQHVQIHLRRDGLEQVDQTLLTRGTSLAVATAAVNSKARFTPQTRRAQFLGRTGMATVDSSDSSDLEPSFEQIPNPDAGGETVPEPSEEDGMVWVLSWFSDQCKRKVNRDCDSVECEVPLAAALDIALAAGIEVPVGTALDELLELLLGHGLTVEGHCGKVYFLGIIGVGCQCVFVTF